jgi:membrane protease YdiL (CAAX protease family)
VNLLFLMPWLLVYELSLFGTQSAVDNAAAAWLRALARTLGHGGLIAVSLLACLLLCVVVLLRLREASKDRGVYGGMLAEGLLYGGLLGLVAQGLAAALPMARAVSLSSVEGAWTATAVALRSDVRDLGLAVGAGIFEELAFRGILLAAIHHALTHGVGTDRVSAAIVAVLVSAYAFSDYHHWGATGEPYDAAVFAFRFHAGIVLGVVFLTRGLGIAAFAHGFYDVLVLLTR